MDDVRPDDLDRAIEAFFDAEHRKAVRRRMPSPGGLWALGLWLVLLASLGWLTLR